MDNKERCEHNFLIQFCPECGDIDYSDAFEPKTDGLRPLDEYFPKAINESI